MVKEKRELARELIKRGQNTFLGGDLETAIEHYEHAVAVDPELPYARFKLGAAQFVRGSHRNALANLRQALRLASPDWKHRKAAGLLIRSLMVQSPAIS